MSLTIHECQYKINKFHLRELSDEELSRFLVSTDLTESDSSGTVTMGLLDTSSGGGRLSGSLGSELLSGSFSSGGLSCGLL
jgi:hypothetical protein